MKLTCEATSTFSCLDCQHKAPAKLYWPLYQARCDHVHRRYSQESPRISIYIGFHSIVYSRLYNGCKLFGGVEFLCRSRSLKVMNNEPETVGSACNTAGNISQTESTRRKCYSIWSLDILHHLCHPCCIATNGTNEEHRSTKVWSSMSRTFGRHQEVAWKFLKLKILVEIPFFGDDNRYIVISRGVRC